MEHLPQSGQAHANGACISIVYYSHLSPVWNEGGEKPRILHFEKQPPQKSHCSSKIPFVVSAGANPSSHQTYWYPPWSKKINYIFVKRTGRKTILLYSLTMLNCGSKVRLLGI